MICRLDHHEDQAGAWDVISDARGRIAWDIGSNVGQAAKVLARNFDHVLAFEPCAESYAILAAESPPNVEALSLAVSDHDGRVRLSETGHSIASGQLTTGVGLQWGEILRWRSVLCRTLDSLLTHNPPPDFIKIDTENHEIQVLRGARRLLAEIRPQVIVEVHKDTNGPLVRSMLEGYELTELRHGDYVPRGGRIWRNHWWIAATPR